MQTIRHVLRFAGLRLALAFVLASAALLVVAILSGSVPGPLAQFVAETAGALLTAGIVLLLERGIEGRPVAEGGLAPRAAPQAIGQGVLIGAALMAAIFGALALAGWYHVARVAFEPLALLGSVVLFLLVALFEEFLFRGILFRQLEGVFGSWAALALSGALFGAAHLANPDATLWSTLAIAIGAGALLGGAYLATRNVWMAVGIHWAWNFFEGPFFGAAVSGNATSSVLVSSTAGPADWTGGAFGPEAGLVALIATLLASVLLLRLAVRRGHIYTPAWLRRGAAREQGTAGGV